MLAPICLHTFVEWTRSAAESFHVWTGFGSGSEQRGAVDLFQLYFITNYRNKHPAGLEPEQQETQTTRTAARPGSAPGTTGFWAPDGLPFTEENGAEPGSGAVGVFSRAEHRAHRNFSCYDSACRQMDCRDSEGSGLSRPGSTRNKFWRSRWRSVLVLGQAVT